MIPQMLDREAAMAARAKHYRARADRPSNRRDSFDGTQARARATLRDYTLREETSDAGVDELIFEGYASITDTWYEMYDWYGVYLEKVRSAAFFETLAQPDLDVPLVLQHDSLRRIARTTNTTLWLSEDDQGLRVQAKLNPLDHDVAYIRNKLDEGLIDEMSFRFRILEGLWNEDFTEFEIIKVDIHRGDVAIVGYGANPYTVGAGLVSGDRAPALNLTKRGSDLITDWDIALRV
jgi:hypothetical protein